MSGGPRTHMEPTSGLPSAADWYSHWPEISKVLDIDEFKRSMVLDLYASVEYISDNKYLHLT